MQLRRAEDSKIRLELHEAGDDPIHVVDLVAQIRAHLVNPETLCYAEAAFPTREDLERVMNAGGIVAATYHDDEGITMLAAAMPNGQIVWLLSSLTYMFESMRLPCIEALERFGTLWGIANRFVQDEVQRMADRPDAWGVLVENDRTTGKMVWAPHPS